MFYYYCSSFILTVYNIPVHKYIHSPVNGHFWCFQFLDMISSATKKILYMDFYEIIQF